MHRKIFTKKAPEAIGPYVQGIDLGNLVLTSGQIPIDPQNGLISSSIDLQVKQSLENIKAIIEAAGLKVHNIVKTTLFINDMNDLKKINYAYEKFFTINNASYPARSCVEVSRLPHDVKVEIEAIAIRY